MPPLGCLPASIRLYGEGEDACVPGLNRDAETFNEKLNATVKALKRRHADLKMAIFDIYTPLRQLAQDPAAYGTCVFNDAVIDGSCHGEMRANNTYI
jgi:phospholipase/lecithinase/hemolysin